MRLLKTYTVRTVNETETKTIARQLAAGLKSGDVLTLSGDLGVGKTTFAKGLALGLDIKRAVTSPTFTIIKEYKGRLPLYHMDAYRLEHSDEDIGFDEYFYGDGVSVIEWASFIEEFLPKERLQVDIKRCHASEREITFTAMNRHYQSLLENLASKKGNRT